jgi:hypothetical protein
LRRFSQNGIGLNKFKGNEKFFLQEFGFHIKKDVTLDHEKVAKTA